MGYIYPPRRGEIHGKEAVRMERTQAVLGVTRDLRQNTPQWGCDCSLIDENATSRHGDVIAPVKQDLMGFVESIAICPELS